MSSKIKCSECDIPDVNCYMQCLCIEDDCDDCFGASFDDCGDCPKHGKEVSHGLQKGRKKEEIGGNSDE